MGGAGRLGRNGGTRRGGSVRAMSGHQVGTGTQTDEGKEGPEKHPTEQQEVGAFGFRGYLDTKVRPKASFPLGGKPARLSTCLS